MAEPLDPTQQNELSTFVDKLFELGGYKTDTQWELESGYPRSNISTLRGRKSGISGYNLLRLMRAVARRKGTSVEEIALQLAREIPSPVEQKILERIESIEGGLKEIQNRVIETLGHVVEIDERLEGPATHRSAAARRGRSRANRPKDSQ